MSAKRLAVLDIGSDILSLVMQDDKHANNFIFKGTADYDGFQDGEFLDIPALFKAVDSLIKKCADTTFCPVTNLLIGVPGEFTTVITKTIQKDLGVTRKVSAKDVEALFEEGNIYEKHATYKAINASPIYFMGDNGQKTINPHSIVTQKLSCNISYVLCERSFLNLFDKLADSIGISFEYTCTTLAELMFVVPTEIRDKGVILADVGYISSTVSYAKGDGLLHSTSFSLGGGNIAGDLTLCLDIPYSHAKELLSKINLNLDAADTDYYTLSIKGEAISYKIADINAVCRFRVEDIAENIAKALSFSKVEIDNDIPIVLTGSGISMIAGAKNIIGEMCNRKVSIIAPDLLQFNKPKHSGIAGLIMVQQQQLIYKKSNLFNKLLQIFSKHRRTE